MVAECGGLISELFLGVMVYSCAEIGGFWFEVFFNGLPESMSFVFSRPKFHPLTLKPAAS